MAGSILFLLQDGVTLPEQEIVNTRFTFADSFQPDVLCSEAEEYLKKAAIQDWLSAAFPWIDHSCARNRLCPRFYASPQDSLHQAIDS